MDLLSLTLMEASNLIQSGQLSPVEFNTGIPGAHRPVKSRIECIHQNYSRAGIKPGKAS